MLRCNELLAVGLADNAIQSDPWVYENTAPHSNPSVSKQQVLELAQGGYVRQAESILMVGNPGLGKTHLAIGLALAACRQGQRVRFYNAAALVNELLEAEQAHRVPKLLNGALKQRVIVLDELGFIPFSPTGAHLIFQFGPPCTNAWHSSSRRTCGSRTGPRSLGMSG